MYTLPHWKRRPIRHPSSISAFKYFPHIDKFGFCVVSNKTLKWSQTLYRNTCINCLPVIFLPLTFVHLLYVVYVLLPHAGWVLFHVLYSSESLISPRDEARGNSGRSQVELRLCESMPMYLCFQLLCVWVQKLLSPRPSSTAQESSCNRVLLPRPSDLTVL